MKTICFVFLLCASFLLIGCSDDDGSTNKPDGGGLTSFSLTVTLVHDYVLKNSWGPFMTRTC